MRHKADKGLLSVFMAILIAVTFTACNFGISEKADDKGTENGKQPYYYNEEHTERYEAYAKANPELSEDEVIWHVEADIDKPVYEDMTVIPDTVLDSEQFLVNKHFVLPEGYEPKELVTLKDGYKATKNTVAAFKEMEKAANADGMELDICSAYRSFERQQKLYSEYVASDGVTNADTYSARPGSSEHHTGRAIDMMGPNGILDDYEDTKSCAWIHENAYKYGFILRYGEEIQDITGYMYESWHITYIGKEASKIMHDEGIKSFEEYWVKYVKYNKPE